MLADDAYESLGRARVGMCVAPVLGFSPFCETTDMLTLRNPRFQDRHPYRAWFRENKHLITAHLLWAILDWSRPFPPFRFRSSADMWPTALIVEEFF